MNNYLFGFSSFVVYGILSLNFGHAQTDDSELKFYRYFDSGAKAYFMVVKSKNGRDELRLKDDQIEKIEEIRQEWLVGMRKIRKGKRYPEYRDDVTDFSEKIIDKVNEQLSLIQQLRIEQLAIQHDRHRSIFTVRVSKALGLSIDDVARLRKTDYDMVNEYGKKYAAFLEEAQKNSWDGKQMRKIVKERGLDEETKFEVTGKKVLSKLTEKQRKKYEELRGK